MSVLIDLGFGSQSYQLFGPENTKGSSQFGLAEMEFP